MSDMEVGNQNQVVNNYDSIIRNNTGAFDKALTDLSNGKAPSVDGGGESFSLLAEVATAKSGPVLNLMSTASDAGMFGGGAVENSAFFGGGGGGKPRTKAEVAREGRLKMALTNSNPMTGKLSRAENLAIWREIRRDMSGRSVKNKSPFQASGFGFTGEKTGGQKKKFPTRSDLCNPHLLKQFGLNKISERISDANRARNNRTLFEDIMGSDMGLEDAKQSLKTQPKDELIRIAETTMTDHKRDSTLQDVLEAEKFFLFRLNQDKSAEAERLRREMEEKARPGTHPALSEDPLRKAAEAAAPAAKTPAAPEPPKPSWAKPPELPRGHGESSSSD